MRFLPILFLCAGLFSVGCDNEDNLEITQKKDASGASGADGALGALDAEVDAEIPVTRCETNDVCGATRICNPESKICVSDVPVLVDVTAYKWENFLSLLLSGKDNGANVVGVNIGFSNSGGQEFDFGNGRTEIPIDFSESDGERATVRGQVFENGRMRMSGLNAITEPVYVRLALRDAKGNVSEMRQYPIVDVPRAAVGEACDPKFYENVCVDDSDCFLVDASYICVGLSIPTIDELTTYYNTQTNALGIIVKGTYTSYPIDGFNFEFFTPEGDKIPYGGTFEEFETLTTDGDTFTGIANWPLVPEMGKYEWGSAKISVLDRGGQSSLWRTSSFSEPPLLDAGAECDFSTALNRCSGSEICYINHCTVITNGTCPTTWLVKPLVEGDGGIFSINDVLANSSVSTLSSCGEGRTDANVYSFTAPAAGKWTFETLSSDEAIDTVLFARRHCAYEVNTSIDNEIACNDDIEPLVNAASRFEIDLQAGETIYLFATYFGWSPSPWVGDYTLQARSPAYTGPSDDEPDGGVEGDADLDGGVEDDADLEASADSGPDAETNESTPHK